MANGIRIEGIPELKAVLDKFGSLVPVKTGLRTGALHLKGKIAIAPPVSRRPVAQFWSDTQRRGFFYHLNRGDIEVPYFRGQSKGSEDLEHSWTISAESGGLRQIVGNDTGYGPLVQDDAQQARYHRDTGWKTIQTVVDEEGPSVVAIIKQVIDALLGGL